MKFLSQKKKKMAKQNRHFNYACPDIGSNEYLAILLREL